MTAERSSNDVAVILDNFRSELNPTKANDVEQNRDQSEHPEIETFGKYSEDLDNSSIVREILI